MFTFAYPGLLFLLLIIPVTALIYIVGRHIRKKRLKRFGDISTLLNLMSSLSPYKSGIKLIISLLALTAIIFALARPWGGIKNQETSREGIEIIIAVDASNSMLASSTGEENGPDRMKSSKLILEKLINRLGNDRVGLIAYAGDAYTLIPVTNDYISAKAFLNSIDPSLIPHQGTNIGAAVSLAEKSFSEKGDIGKALVLLTDAEELEDLQGTVEMVKQATKRGIQTDVIGIGATPVTIPTQYGRMIDEETGEVVYTALNEDLAIEIAKAGNGIYVNAANEDSVDELLRQLGKLKKSALESSFMVSHDELYYPFVIFALLLIIVDFVLTDKKNRLLDKINFFNKAHFIPLWLITAILVCSCSHKEDIKENNSGKENISRRDSLLRVYSLPGERELILKGNDYYRYGNFELADSSFNAALGINKNSMVASLNRGLSTVRKIMEMELNYPSGQIPDSIMGPLYESAKSDFEKASGLYIEKGNVSEKAFYNSGNLYFTQKDFQQAIDAYKEALRLNPGNDNARRNLRIAQLQKKDNDNQNNNQNQENQQKEEQEQQQQPRESQQINEQTSDQILNAAERRENIRRAKMPAQQENTDKSGHSYKKW